MSQVWTARVANLPGVKTTVVLKVIQPSLFKYPAVEDFWPEAYMNPEDLAHEEAYAYDHLVHKQGRCIPYFFGIHTVRFIPDALLSSTH
jgi:hypothetical protein